MAIIMKYEWSALSVIVGSKMEQLCKSTNELCLNAENKRNVDDEFGTIDPGKLTLPLLAPSTIEISLCEYTAMKSLHELLKLLPLPAQSSPLMSAQLTSLSKLTRGDAKTVYR